MEGWEADFRRRPKIADRPKRLAAFFSRWNITPTNIPANLLHAVVRFGGFKTLAWFLKTYKPNLMNVDQLGQTALWFCHAPFLLEKIHLLLEAGMSVDHKRFDGQNAAGWFTQFLCFDVVFVLLDYGARLSPIVQKIDRIDSSVYKSWDLPKQRLRAYQEGQVSCCKAAKSILGLHRRPRHLSLTYDILMMLAKMLWRTRRWSIWREKK